jgi:hypothetical protein
MKHLRFIGLAFAVACGGGGNGSQDASTEGGGPKDAGKDSTISDAASDAQPNDGGPDDVTTGDASDDASDAGSVGDGSAQCTVPATPPSGGSCITLNDASITCNPVTNAPCNQDAGYGCDTDFDGGYLCLPKSTVSLCGDCNEVNGPYCIGTATCLPLSDAGTEHCFRYCCTDSDCAPGHCDKTTYGIAPLGACVQ